MIKIVCASCGRQIERKYRLKKPICNKCKVKRYYNYERKGIYEKFIERNKSIYFKYKAGVKVLELSKFYTLSRERIYVIIRREGQNEERKRINS